MMEDFRTSLVEGLRKVRRIGDHCRRRHHHPLRPALILRCPADTAAGSFSRPSDMTRPASASALNQALAAADGMHGGRLPLPGLSPHTPYTTGEANLPRSAMPPFPGVCPWRSTSPNPRPRATSSSTPADRWPSELYPFVGWEQYLDSAPPLFLHGTAGPPRPADTRDPGRALRPRQPGGCTDLETARRNGLPLPPQQRPPGCGACPAGPVQETRHPAGTRHRLPGQQRLPLPVGRDALCPGPVSGRALPGRRLPAWPPPAAPRPSASPTSLGSLEVGKRADFQIVSHAGSDENGLLERVIGQGRIVDVYLGGLSGAEYTCHRMNTLENAIVRLLRDKPFYGHFLLNLRRSKQTGLSARCRCDGPRRDPDPQPQSASVRTVIRRGTGSAPGTSHQAPAAPAPAAQKRAQSA